ncbi:transcription elongation factor B polypeptide 3-like [Argonauta hians]
MAEVNAEQKLLKCRAYLEGSPTNDKLHYIFNKLLRFPVSIDILQTTGIGKAVNLFRKREGEIGEKARAVVSLWKSLVSKQENSVVEKRSVTATSGSSSKNSSSSSSSRVSSPHNSIPSEQSSKATSDNDNDDDDERAAPRNQTKQYSSPYRSPKVKSSTKECDKSSENVKEKKRHHSAKSSSDTSDIPEKKSKTSSDSKLNKSKDHHHHHQHSSKNKSGSESSKTKEKKSKSSKGKKSSKDTLSFEDFLNYDDSSVKKKFKKHVSAESSKTPKDDTESESLKTSSKSHSLKPSSSSRSSSSKSKESKSKSQVLQVPSPSKEFLPSESEILSLLPETHAHYHPWRLCDTSKSEKKSVTNSGDDLDSVLLGIKSRTRESVYSGKKTVLKEVPTLFSACIQVLIENIDSLEYVGGIPYLILRPVLERCTVSQLYTLEDYNPHFLEDSDTLWKTHCQRDFRGVEPDEMESWREMYLRKFDEREAKLKAVRANITASMSKVTPERTVKMAYVDDPAKPPREVRRNQLKYGTGTITKSELGPYRTYKPVVNNNKLHSSSSSSSASRSVASSSSSRIQVSQQHRTTKVIAPMMQKTMKMMRKMQRR